MPHVKKWGKNETLIALSTKPLEAIEDALQQYYAAFKAVNELYFEERDQLRKAHPEGRPHAGLMLKYSVYQNEKMRFPRAQVVWVQGIHKLNTKEKIEERVMKQPITSHIHHCGKDGNYTKTNINQALKRRSKWEKELTWRYEVHFAQPARRYFNSVKQYHEALSYVLPPPYFSTREFPPKAK